MGLFMREVPKASFTRKLILWLAKQSIEDTRTVALGAALERATKILIFLESPKTRLYENSYLDVSALEYL